MEPRIVKEHTRWELKVIAVLAIAYTAYFAKAIMFPIALSFILFFLLSPIVKFLKKFKIPKALSAAVLILSLFAILSFATSRLVEPGISWINSAPQNLQILEQKLSAYRAPFEKLFTATERMEEWASMGRSRELNVVVDSNQLRNVVLNVTSTAFATVLTTVVLLYFLLIYGDRFLARLSVTLRESVSKSASREIIGDLENGISRYLGFATIINICLGIVIGFAMWILGVPNPYLWGGMATMLNYIPYIGAMLGVIIISLVSIVSFDAPMDVLLPPLTYFLITTIEGQFITPVVLGGALRLSRLMILLSMIFWGWAWGFEGILLSVPILTIIKIITDHIQPRSSFSRLLEV